MIYKVNDMQRTRRSFSASFDSSLCPGRVTVAFVLLCRLEVVPASPISVPTPSSGSSGTSMGSTSIGSGAGGFREFLFGAYFAFPFPFVFVFPFTIGVAGCSSSSSSWGTVFVKSKWGSTSISELSDTCTGGFFRPPLGLVDGPASTRLFGFATREVVEFLTRTAGVVGPRPPEGEP